MFVPSAWKKNTAVMVAKIGNAVKVLDSINKGDIQQVLQVSSMLDPDSWDKCQTQIISFKEKPR